MTSIVVNDDQANAIAQSRGMVEIRSRAGTVLGYVTHGFTAEDISIAKDRFRSQELRLATQEFLRSLRMAGR